MDIRISPRRWFLLMPALLFLLLFYFYPLVKILFLSFFPDKALGQGSLDQLFDSDVYVRVLWFTLWQAGVSTLLTLAAALPGAYIYARYTFRGKNLLRTLSTVPFVLPTVVTAAAFRALLGPNGLINEWSVLHGGMAHPPIQIEQTVWFFLLAHVFYNYTLVLRIVGDAWARMDLRLAEAAALLGATDWQIFRKITLPLLMPALVSASLLVFIFCFTSFGIILILGGPGFATIEVEIYRQAVQLFNLPMAAALSLVQILVNFALMWTYSRLGQANAFSFFAGPGPSSRQIAKSTGARTLISANLLFMVLLLAAPLLALIAASLKGQSGWTLAYYRALFASDERSIFSVPPETAIYNSLLFALATMLLAVLLGLCTATSLASGARRGRTFWESVIMLPLATSAVTLGFGYIITLNRPPLNLRDSILLIPLAHTLVAFPFVVRCLLPTLRAIPESLREAASLLGSSPFGVWRQIDLPLATRSLLIGAIFAFSISLGEFGATSFVARPHTPTMPVAIFRFLSQPGDLNYGQAMAMSSILMLVTAFGFWALEKLSPSDDT
jgi:thiamine transport system permease protein